MNDMIGWLINHIPEFVKTSASDVKEIYPISSAKLKARKELSMADITRDLFWQMQMEVKK